MNAIRFFLLATLLHYAPFNLAGDRGSWSLDASKSQIAYGSIKNNAIGEINYFKKLSGHIEKNGEVGIDIDLHSIETHIGIRNERMLKHIFGGDKTVAKLSATIDMSRLRALSAGATDTIDIKGSLRFLNKSMPIQSSFFIVKLNDYEFVATTNDMIMVTTRSLGIDDGISTLMSLAKLSGITRVTPVTLRLFFKQS